MCGRGLERKLQPPEWKTGDSRSCVAGGLEWMLIPSWCPISKCESVQLHVRWLQASWGQSWAWPWAGDSCLGLFIVSLLLGPRPVRLQPYLWSHNNHAPWGILNPRQGCQRSRGEQTIAEELEGSWGMVSLILRVLLWAEGWARWPPETLSSLNYSVIWYLSTVIIRTDLVDQVSMISYFEDSGSPSEAVGPLGSILWWSAPPFPPCDFEEFIACKNLNQAKFSILPC